MIERAGELIEFIGSVFGAKEKLRIPAPGGRVMHAEAAIGDSLIELSDVNPLYGARPGALHVYVADTDAVYARALEAGASALRAPAEQPYGDRDASVKDRSGNHWYIGTHLGAAFVRPPLRTVTPFLHCAGADKAIEFLKRAFGASEEETHRSEDGMVRHANIRIGDSIVELSEAHAEFQPLPTGFHLYVPDTDAVYKSALAAGAAPMFAPEDKPYGDRSATAIDPSGNYWFIATQIREGSG